jgi:hypothetical protein
MIKNKDNCKTNNVFVANDLVKSIKIDMEKKEIDIKLLDTYDNLGTYDIKFIDVVEYNMIPINFLEEKIEVSDFYLSTEIYDDDNEEYVIELNKDDFIKITCKNIEIDNKKVIAMM